MIISCPQCGTSYNIPDETLRPGGRKVRCSSCSHRWQVTPASSTAQAPEVDDDVENMDSSLPHPDFREAIAEPETESQFRFTPSADANNSLKARTSPKAILGWCLLLVLVASLATFILARQRLAAAFPVLQPVYASLGLQVVEPLKLRLSDVGSEEVLEAGKPVILITGLVINESEAPQMVPDLEVALLDEARGVLEKSSLATVEKELQPGDMTTFEARFPAPPELARQFSVRFLEPEPRE